MELTKHWAAQLEDYVIDLAWAPAGGSLAAAAGSGPISLFSAADGNRLHLLPGHEQGTNCLAYSPASAALATGGQDGAVKLWDCASGQHTATAPLGRDWVEHLAWSTAGLAATAGRKLLLLGPDAALRHAFPEAAKTLSALAWHPTRAVLAAAGFGAVRLWEVPTWTLEKDFPYGNGIQALTWSPDGRWLVSGNQDPSVHLWLPAEDTELQMSGYESKVKHLAFDHTSRWLATSGGLNASLWDCSGGGPEGREPQMLEHATPVCAVSFQNAHGLLATASTNGTVNLWSPERKQPLRATVRMPGAAARLAWSPDDRLLAIGSERGAVYVLKCEP